jgi:hypothetical protein
MGEIKRKRKGKKRREWSENIEWTSAKKGGVGEGSTVGNFRQHNNAAEDGIDETNGLFRRYFGCSAEQKLSGFRSEPFPVREKCSEFHRVELKRSKLSEFSQNHPAEEKQKIEANSRNFVPKHFAEENKVSILFAGHRKLTSWISFSKSCSRKFQK